MILYFVRRDTAWRNGVLIAFSLVFYAWGEPVYVFLMLATVAINYILTLKIAGISTTDNGALTSGALKKRKLLLIITMAADLALLGVFKYTGFIVESLNGIFGGHIPVPHIALPIGISFYTFQVMSYVIDVYRGDSKVQKSVFRLLLYVSLFPQLVAGPIVRYEHIADAIAVRKVNYRQISDGIERFLIGLAKKAILANACGGLAETTLAPDGFSQMSVLSAWFGIIMFAFQIYFDFSAYSDMAIGMGKIFGFKYLENFNYPYIARSAGEFWRRWHISLSTFFRDYVYIPLGGNRKRLYLNLFIVWALTGLWHGASWNFVIWGLYWFVFIVAERLFYRDKIDRWPKPLAHIYGVLVFLIGWAFFYYTDIGDALGLIGHMFGIGANGFAGTALTLVFKNNVFLFVIAVIACLPVGKFVGINYRVMVRKGGTRAKVLFIIRSVLLLALLYVSTIMLVGNSYNPFIYFRF
jgi:alginate O-acetyltransferase complex protein AlgI